MSLRLSSYLRSVADGNKPETPAEVRDTYRKHGFGGKLPKAVVASLLAAFAIGVSLSMQPKSLNSPDQVRLAQEQRSTDKILATAVNFEAIDLKDDTVVNSLLLEKQLRMQTEFTQQVDVKSRDGQPRRVVVFTAGRDYYVNDMQRGVFLMPREAMKDPASDVAKVAQETIRAGLDGHAHPIAHTGRIYRSFDKATALGVMQILSEDNLVALFEHKGSPTLAVHEGGPVREGDKVHIASADERALSVPLESADANDFERAVVQARGWSEYSVGYPADGSEPATKRVAGWVAVSDEAALSINQVSPPRVDPAPGKETVTLEHYQIGG